MSKPTPLPVLRRIGLAVAASFAAAVAVAVVLGITDLYFTGHGWPSLMREVVSWAPGGVHLSAADGVVLAAAAMAASGAWKMSRP